MKKLIGLLAVSFIANSAQVFATDKKCTIGEKTTNGGYVFHCLSEQEKQESRYAGYVGLETAKEDLKGDFTWDQAVATCDASTEGGFSNWTLPTVEMLYYMFHNLQLATPRVGNFPNRAFYWSSSEYSSGEVILYYFSYDYHYGNPAASIKTAPDNKGY